MTITIRRSTAAVLIALVGVLAGLAISNVTNAHSSDPPATASYASSPFEQTLKNIEVELRSIGKTLGRPGDGYYNILGELKKLAEAR